jgi:hypothetical protein
MTRSVGRKTSSISKARSYAEIGRFWDGHDLTQFWHRTRPIKFKVFLHTPKQRVRERGS